ncbi:kinetochore protein SPC25 homolog isoform X1 [Glycine max]|uniref:kinetochore protein SPC25 homolog isoform X1 n=1 Tax=Glycine max TaxID=3847 RepID=UPI001B354B9A|nr:kinetochore protein SPC25 homolog isoform X1 [Glycine max]
MASICDKDIPLRLHNIDAFIASYRNSLHSLRATALEAARSQSELAEVKAKLREAEDELVKALAVKTRREAKRMALKEAIVSVKGRIEDLKTSIQKQRTQNEECATVVSHHRLVLEVSEQKSNESSEHRDEVQEAISWYNRILGFQIEGGRGVKFSFKNINVDNPNEEFFFTIRHEDDVYTLLNCKPSVKDTDELIHELNNTNGLFKFVRTMRKKFQEVVAQGRLSMTTNEHQESAFISASGPVLSISTITEDNDHQDEPTKGNAHLQKQVNRRRVKSAILSPGSASSVRQSPRLKEMKRCGGCSPARYLILMRHAGSCRELIAN